MKPKYICGGTKYAIGGLTIALPVELSDLPKEINLEGETLIVKSEFHSSLVCIGEIIRKQQVAIADFENKILADFCAYVEKYSIDLLRYRNEFRFASENDLRSVVIMCDVSNLEPFFTIINEKYNLRLEFPPTHVTLYTVPSKRGIFLTDQDDIEKLTKLIPNPTGLKIDSIMMKKR